MNSLAIPPSPNWYSNSILTCAPDGTLVYGARNEIVVLKTKVEDEAADVKIIPYAHSARIISVSVNPGWGDSSKLAVTAGEDSIVHLWDLESFTPKLNHKGHSISSDKIVAAVFSGNDRVISANESGLIIMWRLGTNELTSLKNIFGFKVRIRTLSLCPHKTWMMAFGLENGLVVVADLRKNGRLLHKLRGHDKAVTSLSWSPSPFNVFPDPVIKRKVGKIITRGPSELPSETEDKPSSAADENVEIEEKNASDEPQRELISALEIVEEADERDVLEEIKDAMESGEEKDDASVGIVDDELPQQEETSEEKATDFVSHEQVITGIVDMTDSESALGAPPSIIISSPSSDTSSSLEKTQESEKLEASASSECEGSKQSAKESSLDETKKETAGDEVLKTDMPEGSGERNIVCDEKEGKKKEIEEEYFLASASKAGNICIWKTKNSGRLYTELNNYCNKPYKSYGRRSRDSDRAWISLCWLKPDTLLSSAPSGQVLHWNLLSAHESKPKPRIIHEDHSNSVFCMTAPVKILSVPDEKDSEEIAKVWTCGQDRLLLNTSLGSDRKNLVCLPTCGGNVFSLVSSPVDPTRIAIGYGDGTAKIWDLSRPHLSYITMVHLWQKINGKVLSLAWHPTKELLLAYGTSEGRIGVIDTSNPSKTPNLLPQYFKSDVFKVEWGPYCNDSIILGLYACSAGKLVVYNVNQPLKDPVLINDYTVTFAWKTDNSVLAVGTKTGEVKFFSAGLSPLSSIYLLKGIKSLYWRPIGAGEFEDSSANWLAIVTNESAFYVYDCKTATTDAIDGKVELMAKLEGHEKCIKSIAWSSHDSNKLASAGEDGVVVVWDVKTREMLSTFVGHNFECVLSVLWSPLDQDHVITGAKDNTVRIWKISEHPPIKQNFVNMRKKHLSKFRLQNANQDQAEEDESCEPEGEQEGKKSGKKGVVALKTITRHHREHLLEDCERLLEMRCVCNGKVADEKAIPRDKHDSLGLFEGHEAMFGLLEFERAEHEMKKRFQSEQNVSLWLGDISESIKKATSNGSLTPWLISLAPMASPKLWLEACEAYAKQLCEKSDSDPLETVSYFLACHKVEQAVDVLINASMFYEALAIAKVRLSQNQAFIDGIFKKWATHCLYTGAFEIAAQIFLHLGEYEEAAKVLYKRSDCKTLTLAVKLAEKTGNKDLHEAVKARCRVFEEHEKNAACETCTEPDKTTDDGGGGDVSVAE